MASTFVARGAAGYDRFMGRWSRRLAPLFLDFAGPAPGERVLDVGCGTGNLSLAMRERAAGLDISAIDFEPDFVAALRARDPAVAVEVGDACALAFPDAGFDRALSLLVMQFVSDAGRAVAEMRRVVRPGGTVGAAVWDTFGGMPQQRIFWDSFVALEPAMASHRAVACMRPTSQPGELSGIFAAAGLKMVEEALLTIRMDFAEFEDYWQPLIHGQGVLASLLEALPPPRAERVREAVREAYLCGRPDGPRGFSSSAWAVRGTVPAG